MAFGEDQEHLAAGALLQVVGGFEDGVEHARLQGRADGQILHGDLNGVGTVGEVARPVEIGIEGHDGGLASAADDEGLNHASDAAKFWRARRRRWPSSGRR